MSTLQNQEDKLINNLESFLGNDLNSFQDNLQNLLKDYKRKSKRLDTIIKRSDKQEMQLIHLNEELDEYKNHLERKVEEGIKNRKEKEKMLLQQSKLAVMGEMMDAVAHQWKQPIVLNIINNSKDAFNDNHIKNRKIKINILSNENTKSIEIQDNAGGISSHIIDDIFKANVTSKAEGKVTGIGLYMSSQIAEKHNGKLSVENIESGAKFTFEIKNDFISNLH